MPQWFERTDLNFLVDLEDVTEKRLVGALDSLEGLDAWLENNYPSLLKD